MCLFSFLSFVWHRFHLENVSCMRSPTRQCSTPLLSGAANAEGAGQSCSTEANFLNVCKHSQFVRSKLHANRGFTLRSASDHLQTQVGSQGLRKCVQELAAGVKGLGHPRLGPPRKFRAKKVMAEALYLSHSPSRCRMKYRNNSHFSQGNIGITMQRGSKRSLKTVVVFLSDISIDFNICKQHSVQYFTKTEDKREIYLDFFYYFLEQMIKTSHLLCVWKKILPSNN